VIIKLKIYKIREETTNILFIVLLLLLLVKVELDNELVRDNKTNMFFFLFEKYNHFSCPLK